MLVLDSMSAAQDTQAGLAQARQQKNDRWAEQQQVLSSVLTGDLGLWHDAGASAAETLADLALMIALAAPLIAGGRQVQPCTMRF